MSQAETDMEAGTEVTTEQRSQLQSYYESFVSNKLSLAGIIIVLTLLLMAIFAPIITPHDPLTRFDAPEGEYHPVSPGTEVTELDDRGEEVGTVTSYLGTDNQGRDILTRTVYGLRIMLLISITSISIAYLFGVVFGMLAGYYRDTWRDELVMRIMDVIFAFPTLILAAALLGVLGLGTTEIHGFLMTPTMKVILVVGIAYIPFIGRVMRSAVLKEMEEDYVTAAQSTGASDRRVMVNDILPNSIPVTVVQATMYLGTAAIAAAGLSFLGLGVQPPKASLGLMLSDSRDYIHSGEWWFSFFPGLAIVVSVVGFNLLGDGLRDALDPKHSTEELE